MYPTLHHTHTHTHPWINSSKRGGFYICNQNRRKNHAHGSIWSDLVRKELFRSQEISIKNVIAKDISQNIVRTANQSRDKKKQTQIDRETPFFSKTLNSITPILPPSAWPKKGCSGRSDRLQVVIMTNIEQWKHVLTISLFQNGW